MSTGWHDDGSSQWKEPQSPVKLTSIVTSICVICPTFCSSDMCDSIASTSSSIANSSGGGGAGGNGAAGAGGGCGLHWNASHQVCWICRAKLGGGDGAAVGDGAEAEAAN